jgi:hypothetical protein
MRPLATEPAPTAPAVARCGRPSAEANALAGPDTILAPPGVYNMTLGGADEDLGRTGDLDIFSDVTIIGLGTTRIESAVGRVIHVLSGNVSITGLTRSSSATRTTTPAAAGPVERSTTGPAPRSPEQLHGHRLHGPAAAAASSTAAR